MTIDQVSLPLAFAAGLVSFLSPCVLPLVPAYLAYLARQANRAPIMVRTYGPGALDTATSPLAGPSLVASGLSFVLGLSLVFVALFYLLYTLLAPFRTVVAPVAGIVVIVLGLSTAGLFRLPFLDYQFPLQRSAPARGGPLGALLLGIGFAAGWSPCIGITLGAVISSGINQGASGWGLLLMVAYCLGLGLPFVLMSLGVEKGIGLAKALGRNRRAIDLASGAVLVAMGLLLMTGNLIALNSVLGHVLPGQPFGL